MIAQTFQRSEQMKQILRAQTFDATREVCDSRDLVQVPSDRAELGDGGCESGELAIWQRRQGTQMGTQ